MGATIDVEPAALHTFFAPIENVNESEIRFPRVLSEQGKYTARSYCIVYVVL